MKKYFNAVKSITFSHGQVLDNGKDLQGAFCNARFTIKRARGADIIGRVFFNIDNGQVEKEIKFYKGFQAGPSLQDSIFKAFREYIKTLRDSVKPLKPVKVGDIMTDRGLFVVFKRSLHTDDHKVDIFTAYPVPESYIQYIDSYGIMTERDNKRFYYKFKNIKTHDQRLIDAFVRRHQHLVC